MQPLQINISNNLVQTWFPSEEITARLLDRATVQGYLSLIGEKQGLIPKGKETEVEFFAKSRLGPYFLWSQELHPISKKIDH